MRLEGEAAPGARSKNAAPTRPSVLRGRSRGTSPGAADATRAGFSKEFLRKEVIQPQVPLRLPCYDLVPITGFIFGACR
jgi:hypothetical protein